MYKFDIASTFTNSKSTIIYLNTSGCKQHKLRKDFVGLANQLPYKAKKLQLTSIQPKGFKVKNIDKLFSPPPV